MNRCPICRAEVGKSSGHACSQSQSDLTKRLRTLKRPPEPESGAFAESDARATAEYVKGLPPELASCFDRLSDAVFADLEGHNIGDAAALELIRRWVVTAHAERENAIGAHAKR